MSRRFSYPPSGYSGKNRYGNEALIERIKLQKEREWGNAKAERKNERKRDTKEKKWDKTGTLKLNTSEISHHDKADKEDKSWIDFQEGYGEKNEDEAEQLERSSLTEEHELPVGSQHSSCSSDSTQSSNKRKRQESPIGVSRGRGNIIRIRLSSQKSKESDALAVRKQVCPTSGRIDVPSQPKQEIASRNGQEPIRHGTTMNVVAVLPPVPDIEQCSSSGRAEIKQECIPSTSGLISGLTSFQRKLIKKNMQYKDLTENWFPQALQFDQQDLDDDWLFGRKNQVRGNNNKSEVISNMSTCSSVLSRAHPLPEIGICALPYTVPL